MPVIASPKGNARSHADFHRNVCCHRKTVRGSANAISAKIFSTHSHTLSDQSASRPDRIVLHETLPSITSFDGEDLFNLCDNRNTFRRFLLPNGNRVQPDYPFMARKTDFFVGKKG
jgi:hypothetical protein